MTAPHPRSVFISQETKRRPCAFYARLREQEPLSRFIDEDGGEAWMTTNYDNASHMAWIMASLIVLSGGAIIGLVLIRRRQRLDHGPGRSVGN
jgi:hypothetical protein